MSFAASVTADIAPPRCCGQQRWAFFVVGIVLLLTPDGRECRTELTHN
jgi:hypothetical protein